MIFLFYRSSFLFLFLLLSMFCIFGFCYSEHLGVSLLESLHWDPLVQYLHPSTLGSSTSDLPTYCFFIDFAFLFFRGSNGSYVVSLKLIPQFLRAVYFSDFSHLLSLSSCFLCLAGNTQFSQLLSSCSQSLLLALPCGITPVGARGIIWDMLLGTRSGLAACRAVLYPLQVPPAALLSS